LFWILAHFIVGGNTNGRHGKAMGMRRGLSVV